MSKKKLTLSVEEQVIRRAKRFSAEHDTTVSQLVSDFLASLDAESETVPPVVASLRGLISPDATPEAYREHLRRKHGS